MDFYTIAAIINKTALIPNEHLKDKIKMCTLEKFLI